MTLTRSQTGKTPKYVFFPFDFSVLGFSPLRSIHPVATGYIMPPVTPTRAAIALVFLDFFSFNLLN